MDAHVHCWVCCEGDEHGTLLPTGCACRGSAGFAHIDCLVTAATHNVDSWTHCPTCTQEYTGEADVRLSRARWELVRDRPTDNAERLFVANNLAVTLKESAGDDEGALQLMKEVLKVRRRIYGSEHEETLDSMANLALQHLEMGNFDAALPLNEEALAGMRWTFGDEHEHTLVAMAALGALHNSMGNYCLAQPLNEKALELRRLILGDDHLETMNSRYHLGRCLFGLGEYPAGLAMLEEAVRISRRVLGEAHPDAQKFAEGLEECATRIENTTLPSTAAL